MVKRDTLYIIIAIILIPLLWLFPYVMYMVRSCFYAGPAVLAAALITAPPLARKLRRRSCAQQLTARIGDYDVTTSNSKICNPIDLIFIYRGVLK